MGANLREPASPFHSPRCHQFLPLVLLFSFRLPEWLGVEKYFPLHLPPHSNRPAEVEIPVVRNQLSVLPSLRSPRNSKEKNISPREHRKDGKNLVQNQERGCDGFRRWKFALSLLARFELDEGENCFRSKSCLLIEWG